MWLWRAVAHGGNAEEAPMIFEAEAGDLTKSCPVKEIVMQQQDVRSGQTRWQEYCIMQFLCTPEHETAQILSTIPSGKQGGVGWNPHQPPPPPTSRPDDRPPPPPPPNAPTAREPQRFRIDTPEGRSRTPNSRPTPTEPTRVQFSPESSRSRTSRGAHTPDSMRIPTQPCPAVELIRRHLSQIGPTDDRSRSRSSPASTQPYSHYNGSSPGSTLPYGTPEQEHEVTLPLRTPESTETYDTARSGAPSTSSSSLHEPPTKVQRRGSRTEDETRRMNRRW